MNVQITGLFDKQKDIINSIVNSDAKYHILNASRQSSKSYSLSRLAVVLALSISNDFVQVISPTYDQVRIIYDNIKNIKNIQQLIKSKKDSKPYEINLINNTRISFKSADRPDSLRGSSNRFVLIDEFSFIKATVFETVIRPTTAAKKNSKIIIASTPKGTINDFYNMAQLGQSDDTNYKYHFMHYLDNPYYDLKEVEDARLRLPTAIFNQEYEAQFIESGGDVFEGIGKVSILDNIIKYDKDDRYFSGIDWGRAQDKTVLTILNKNRQSVFCKSFGGNWAKQINDLGLILNEYKPILYAESNGIGDPLISQLKTKYSNVRPFVTSNSSKKEIIENLRMIMLKEEIELPTKKANIQLFKELSNFTFSISKTGLITYHHRPNENDDFVDSLAISNYCYDKHNKSFSNVVHQRKSNFYS